MKFLRWLVVERKVLGLYFVNFIFQKILHITSSRVFLMHFTNVISADKGFVLVGQGAFAERCLRINGGIMVQASNGVKLDRSTLLGPGVKIISGNHDLDNFSAPSTPCAPICIAENCWIGANAVILPGVNLKAGTIVGAGSVVTKSFEEGDVVVAGNPAKIICQKSQLHNNQ
jgi:acetyltransferase-like isoleucine patch superfamily enzyme